ncbi:MAG: glycerophosphodiester phosphodiesterase family protein [Pseudomonadota bacterium]
MAKPSPNATPEAARRWLTAQAFAHRGLHDAARGVPENSLAAFAEAIAQGFGIELDVRLAADNVAMVFHDATLDRLTGMTGPIEHYSSQFLGDTPLLNSTETIPTLRKVLSFIAGRVPVLIEVKSNHHVRHRLLAAVRHALEGYGGPVGVMSFDPEVAQWFSRQRINVVRGLVVTHHSNARSRWLARLPFGLALLGWRARQPHFLAYDLRSLPNRHAARQRRRGLPILSWTVRSEADLAKARAHADNVIFEAVQPLPSP